MNKPTRFAIPHDLDKVIVGRDLANIFISGHVYDVREKFGEIVITDLGEHAVTRNPDLRTMSDRFMNMDCLFTKEEVEEAIKDKSEFVKENLFK